MMDLKQGEGKRSEILFEGDGISSARVEINYSTDHGN